MTPCLDGTTDPNSVACGQYQEEMSDVQAYHGFISGLAGPAPASSAFVVFHNLVTASVSNVANLQGAVRNYFCAKDVLQTEPAIFGADLPAVALGAPAAVPGLAPQHRLLSCPQ